MSKKKKSIEERFWEKISKNSITGCWEWKASVDKDGYGYFHYLGKKNQRAHKAAYMMFVGEIPPGICVCHKCDNPGCVNPNHLFLGTQTENDLDRDKKGRQARGEKSGNGKLKEKDVKMIRKLYGMGASPKMLGQAYHVSRVAIVNCCTGKSWRHI